jgi:hypothetical protein
MSRRNRKTVQKAIEKEQQGVAVDIFKEAMAIPSCACTGVIVSPRTLDKSTEVRLTFNEYDGEKPHARVAVTLAIEDVQLLYNTLTTLLQNMREMGRIS